VGVTGATATGHLERAEIGGYRDLWEAVPAALREAHGIAALERAGAVCRGSAAQSGSRYMNQVVGLGLDGTATDDDLDEIERFYARLGAVYFVAVTPGPAAGALTRRLAERGFEEDYAWVKFRRGVEAPPPARTDLRVELIGPELADAFGAVEAGTFPLPDGSAGWLAVLVGRPGWHCFLALDGDEPAAAGALYVEGDQGWVAFGATLEAHRGRGAQTAILAARIRHAAAIGCTALVVETGEASEGRAANSYRNILRAGFVEAYVRPNHRSPGS
jgi:hypothetical protein